MISGKKKNRKPLGVMLFLAAIGVLVLTIAVFLVKKNLELNGKRIAFNSKVESLKKELSDLEKRKNEIEALNSRFSDKEYLEKEIRDLGYKKPGEKVVVVLLPEEKKEEKEIQANKSFLEKWQGIISVKAGELIQYLSNFIKR